MRSKSAKVGKIITVLSIVFIIIVIAISLLTVYEKVTKVEENRSNKTQAHNEVVPEDKENVETIDIVFEPDDGIEVIGEFPEEQEDFIIGYYKLLDEGRFQELYDLSPKKIGVEVLKSLYKNVESVNLTKIELTEKNNFRLDVSLIEYGVETIYRTELEVEEDLNSNYRVSRSSSKIVGGWKRFENDVVAFSYPEEFVLIYNQFPQFHFVHIKDSQNSDIDAGYGVIEFRPIYYNEVGAYYCRLSHPREFELSTFDGTKLNIVNYKTASGLIGNGESALGESICDNNKNMNSNLEYFAVDSRSLDKMKADAGLGVPASPILEFVFNPSEYENGEEVFTKIIQSIEFI